MYKCKKRHFLQPKRKVSSYNPHALKCHLSQVILHFTHAFEQQIVTQCLMYTPYVQISNKFNRFNLCYTLSICINSAILYMSELNIFLLDLWMYITLYNVVSQKTKAVTGSSFGQILSNTTHTSSIISTVSSECLTNAGKLSV